MAKTHTAASGEAELLEAMPAIETGQLASLHGATRRGSRCNSKCAGVPPDIHRAEARPGRSGRPCSFDGRGNRCGTGCVLAAPWCWTKLRQVQRCCGSGRQRDRRGRAGGDRCLCGESENGQAVISRPLVLEKVTASIAGESVGRFGDGFTRIWHHRKTRPPDRTNSRMTTGSRSTRDSRP